MAPPADLQVRERSSGSRGHNHGVDQDEAVGWVGRVGVCARGLLYLLIAVLAADVALGHSSQSSDREGALQAVAQRPLGSVLVALLGVGFAGHAVWQAARAVTGRQGGASGRPLDTGHRVVAAATAVAYAGFTASVVPYIGRHHQRRTSNQAAQGWTARLMGEPGGRLLVAAFGVGVVVAGIVLLVQGVRGKVDDGVEPGLRGWPRRLLEGLGIVGFVARGVVVAVAGGFLVAAAVTFDPGQAKGLDGSLRSLARAPGGALLLLAAAVGLAAFGLWSIAVGVWMDAPTS
ncbi:MAG TPA: DUF1206 domain-containing protein [Acidimicrobiales bacterium]